MINQKDSNPHGVVRITMLEIPWHVPTGNWRDLVRLVRMATLDPLPKAIEHKDDEK